MKAQLPVVKRACFRYSIIVSH